jgi:hypothetical protein
VRDGGARVSDVVHYGVPGGALFHRFVVCGNIELIFTSRQLALGEIFAGPDRR